MKQFNEKRNNSVMKKVNKITIANCESKKSSEKAKTQIKRDLMEQLKLCCP